MDDFAVQKSKGGADEERSYVNWLYHVPGLGRKKMDVILSRDILPKELYNMRKEQICFFLRDKCSFSEKQAETAAESIERMRKEKTPECLEEQLYQKKILFLMPGDPEYPAKLCEIPDPPFALYMKGNRETALQISHKSVAIIGARECSEYGKYVADLLGKRSAQLGLGVVSGMACGVDGIAQNAALKGGTSVAAVLGSGVDVCYPHINRRLYEMLVQNGCVYSEYVPGTEPKPTNFPPRNRIISGMADALIVVEAKEKSGTLITVDMALEQGKEVYVVPGRLNDPMSKGCNRLIRQGASVVCDVDEVLDEISYNGLHKTSICKSDADAEENVLRNPYPVDSLRHTIYRAMDMQPRSVQQIYESTVWRETKMQRPTVGELQAELFYMQMEGTIWERNGRFGVS